MSPKILVYGWYGQGNLGDDLFVECFKKLFPTFNFIFTDHIKASHLENVDAVFFGGGSFLTDKPKISIEALAIIKTLKVFYIGVGAETRINPIHQELMSLAKLIAIRSSINFDLIKIINDNTIIIQDLVYCLSGQSCDNKIKNSILIIPNILIVPKWNDPHWKHVAWDSFKTEFSQLLDEYCLENYKINFLPMCINDYLDDQNAAAEIINGMNEGRKSFILNKDIDIKSVIETISKYELVISQRFHGTVLARLAGTTCLTIHHHDKLKNISEYSLSYYGFSKSEAINQINKSKVANISDVLPIDRNIYDGLVQTVVSLMAQV
jgi:polysaccharide pyruvyl transferase WcaK-like protein